MIKSALLYSVIALSLVGCAGLSDKEKAIDQLNRQVHDLKMSLDDSNSRLSDLNNKFILLHEKVETSRVNIDKLSAVPATPPEGLRIVSLGEEAADIKKTDDLKKKSDKADKALSVTREEPQPIKASGPEAIYNRGQDQFISGKYNEARSTFLSLVKSVPNHELSDNALYWVGESYYCEKDFEKALLRFKDVADKYPEGNKAPDALLKVGFSYLELEKAEQAKEAFENLVSRYPDSGAADKAKKALESSGVKKEGSK